MLSGIAKPNQRRQEAVCLSGIARPNHRRQEPGSAGSPNRTRGGMLSAIARVFAPPKGHGNF